MPVAHTQQLAELLPGYPGLDGLIAGDHGVSIPVENFLGMLGVSLAAGRMVDHPGEAAGHAMVIAQVDHLLALVGGARASAAVADDSPEPVAHTQLEFVPEEHGLIAADALVSIPMG